LKGNIEFVFFPAAFIPQGKILQGITAGLVS
jgi:hypothetical protein